MIPRHAILFPLLAYVLLTAIVALVMYRRRAAEMVVVLWAMWGLIAWDLVVAGRG